LSVGFIRAGGLGGVGQDQGLGPVWAQSLDRRRQKEIAPQRAGDRVGQQACPLCMGGSQQGACVRMREDARDGVPTCMSVAPCSEPSRPSPAGCRTERPVLQVLCVVPRTNRRTGRRNGPNGTNKGTAPKSKIAIM